MDQPIWSDGDTATLVQLVDNTKYRVIAVMLGKSVNAVCAKVKRMRDLNEIPNSKSRAPKYIVPKEQRPVDPREQIAKPAIDWAGYLAATERMEQEALEKRDELLTLEEVTDEGCHFVVGDPRESARVYCSGKAVFPGMPGKCYCADHLPRMYKTATVTSRVKPRVYEPQRCRREYAVAEFA